MIIGLGLWFIVWAASVWVHERIQADQGEAFFWIHIGMTLVIAAVTLLFEMFGVPGFFSKIAFLLSSMFMEVVVVGLVILAAYGASHVLRVKFSGAYQVVALIAMLVW